MSTTGGRLVGQPALRVYPFFLGRPPSGRDAYIERAVKIFGIVGSPGFDRSEDDLRDVAARSYDRDPTSGGTQRQLAAVLAAGDRRADLKRITSPTLVIHGTKDRLVKPSGGKATARAIDGARLTMVDGMGHDLPRGAWPQLIGAIAEHAARVSERQQAA
jgi:pimeloyl-ACP methyl ester carboxylesterase